MVGELHHRAGELVRHLVESGAATPGEIVGCTGAEVRALEARYGVRLPAAYRLFLTTLGREAGLVSVANTGLSLFYREVASLTENVRQDPMFHVLPERAYVFASDQSIRYWFFVADGRSEDPEVFSWLMEGASWEAERAGVWDFLERKVLALAHLLRGPAIEGERPQRRAEADAPPDRGGT